MNDGKLDELNRRFKSSFKLENESSKIKMIPYETKNGMRYPPSINRYYLDIFEEFM